MYFTHVARVLDQACRKMMKSTRRVEKKAPNTKCFVFYGNNKSKRRGRYFQCANTPIHLHFNKSFHAYR